MIPLGYRITEQLNSKIGFRKEKTVVEKAVIIQDNTEAHLLTIAPTGAGKGRSQIIPTCLTYPGSLIVFDIKGEAALVTARARKRFGPVIIIDPFKAVTKTPGRFNPFDICSDKHPAEQQGIMIAKGLQNEGYTYKSDPYWDVKAGELIAALCIHEFTRAKSFLNLRKLLFSDNVDYTIAHMLDSKEITNDFAKELFAAYLQTPSDKTRPCILSSAQQHLAILGDPAVLETLKGPTSFDSKDLLSGDPITLYFVMPPNKLSAYSVLMRLWINTLFNLFTERLYKPKMPTLFIIDEAANIGRMEAMVTAITLLRSYGLRIWTMFQDLGQLKQLYPNEWSTIINNCDVINVFGIRTNLMAKEIADLLGEIRPAQLLRLPKEHGIICRPGSHVEIIKRLDYLKDPLFKNTGFEANPFYKEELENHTMVL